MSEEITYLVANYNNGRFFPELLASLEAQTDMGWRALVTDDGSTDDSVRLIERALGESAVSGRIAFSASSVNRGYIATQREQIARAPTDIVAILDADDALMPGMTAALRGVFRSDPRIGIVMTRYEEWSEDFSRLLGVSGYPPGPGLTTLENGRTSASRAYRRRLYFETAGLDDAMIYAEDIDLTYKFEERCRITFLEEPLLRYRVRGDSHTHDPTKQAVGFESRWRAAEAAWRRRGGGWLQWIILWGIFSTHPWRPACRDLLTPFERWRMWRLSRRRDWRGTDWLDD